MPGPLRSVLMPSAFLMVAMFNLTLIVAGLPELILGDLGGDSTDASLFFSIEMMAYVIFAPLWGLASDRLGRRRPLVVIGFLASGLIYLSYLTVDSIGLLLALRFVQGAFTVMGWSTLMAMVLDQPNRARRGRYMGLMGGALIFGISLGAPIGGLLSRGLGVRAPLAIAGGLFLLLSLGALALPESRSLRRTAGFRAIVRTLSQRPRLLVPYAFQFVDRYTVGLFLVLFPQYLATLGVEDPAVRGRFLALFLLPFALLQYVTGRITDRIGPYLPLIVGSALYGCTLALVGISDLFDLGWVMAGLGVLAALMFPPSISLVAELSDPDTRASAMGGFNVAGSLGFAVGPIVGNWIYAWGGFGAAFAAAGAFEVLLSLGLLTFLVVAKRRAGRSARAL